MSSLKRALLFLYYEHNCRAIILPFYIKIMTDKHVDINHAVETNVKTVKERQMFQAEQ